MSELVSNPLDPKVRTNRVDGNILAL
jgi:hypothetical protein